jgi:riboflavin kinase/FMN adenylyltransferase
LKVTWGLGEVQTKHSTATTLGSYDGVHVGHRAIIDQLAREKLANGLDRSVLVTFHPHPQQVLRRNDTSIQLLTSIEERLELLSTTGIDEVVVIEFTHEFSKTSYIDFFKDVMVGLLGTKLMVVGHNHAFGKNREGDAEHLKILAPQLGVKVEEIGPLSIGDISVSSTKIRKAIVAGDLRTAAMMLGRPYSFSGIVKDGDKLGRTIGYPTANINLISEKLIPSDGVYACRVWRNGGAHDAALSIGARPTVGAGLERVVEVFLMDFKGELYNDRLRVDCIEFMRPQEKFASMDLLRKQIEIDVANCKSILKNLPIFV